jgi:hypothetical protein
MGTVQSTFTRKMPPLAVRCLMGVAMFGVAGPIIRILDWLGRAPSFAASMAERRQRAAAARNPLQTYTPTSHDVFVAAHVKSGTNWMMQIAHQLAFHGDGEYDHIHSVVAWPDVAMMGPMNHYAIPIDDPSVWMASPEKKRIIKTHLDWDWLPYSEDARYLIVIRDPKDVFVSSYFFFVKNGPLSFHEILGRDLAPDFPLIGHGRVVLVAGEHCGLLGAATSEERPDRSFQRDEAGPARHRVESR